MGSDVSEILDKANLTLLSTDPDQAKVISLQDARWRFSLAKCKHFHMTIDQTLYTVKCDDCGEKLNPVDVLARFAGEESRWAREAAALRELHRRLDARRRCKCQHCGAMTRINL